MATGRTPFVTASIADACNKHLNTVPPGVRSIVPALPPPLEALIARMLAKKPELRPQSMADIVRAFEVVGRTTPQTMGLPQPVRVSADGRAHARRVQPDAGPPSRRTGRDTVASRRLAAQPRAAERSPAVRLAADPERVSRGPVRSQT